jgi:carbonic anhydrase
MGILLLRLAGRLYDLRTYWKGGSNATRRLIWPKVGRRRAVMSTISKKADATYKQGSNMRASQIKSLLALAAALGSCAAAAGSWDTVVTLNGQSIELDKSRIGKLADGRALAWSRLALGRDFIDENGMRYTAIEALNRYDCEKHSYTTLKRVYRRDGKTVRTENVATPHEMAAEPGGSDEKLLAEACKRPGVATAGGAPVVEAKPMVMYADVRGADANAGAGAGGKPATPAADKKGDPKGEPKPDPRDAGKKADPKDTARKADPKGEPKPDPKAADKTADGKSGERPHFIELPKIDKSKVEDPGSPPKADAKDAKSAKTPAAAPKPADKTAERARVPERTIERAPSYRAELERQYASSGPRRVVKPKPRTEPAEPVVEHRDIHWSYEGEGAPANWAKLRPDYAGCAAGKRQSPIDIRETIRVDLEPILFDYKLSRFSIVDNGHTIQVNIGDGSSMQVMERSYQLVQFHFHKPSEERINGRAYDMVVHLVHQDEAGRLAVIAVPLERGSEHPLIQTVWNNLPLDKDQEVAPSWTIDPSQLLPPSDRRAYFTYMGSLTTPPCTEDVLWMVFKQPVQVSSQQIAIFSKLYMNNARPIQPSNGRLIKENR